MKTLIASILALGIISTPVYASEINGVLRDTIVTSGNDLNPTLTDEETHKKRPEWKKGWVELIRQYGTEFTNIYGEDCVPPNCPRDYIYEAGNFSVAVGDKMSRTVKVPGRNFIMIAKEKPKTMVAKKVGNDIYISYIK